MSFLLDPPLLFLSGTLIYFAGKRLELNRHAKIVVGAAVVLTFIVFSTLLYADVFRCVFPVVCDGLTGSEFMLHTDLTGISKEDVPMVVPFVLFLLYPVWIYFGYAFAFIISKRRHYPMKIYSYNDVKSKQKPRSTSSEYVVVRDLNPRECVKKALEELEEKLGRFNLIEKDDKVLIKVNICGGIPENEGTFTNIEVADAVVDWVLERKPKIVKIVDADMIWTKFRPAADAEGWVKWEEKKRAEKKPVELVNLSGTEIVNFDFGEVSPLQREKVSREMIGANVIISIPTMKTHLLTDVTLGMKNMYGTLPEIDKAKYHKKGIHEVIYWINKAFTPNLVIIDGTIGGETIGPLSCDPVYFNTIVASNDVVTADAIACQLMGYLPLSQPKSNEKESIDVIEHIKIAHTGKIDNKQLGDPLGDASIKFDLDQFHAKYEKHPKDGSWDLPEEKVTEFYEWGIEFLMKFPGWATFFNIGADFFLYDIARLPIVKYFTPAILATLDDVLYFILGEKSEEAKKRRRTNLPIVLLVALASLLGFYLEGFFFRASLFFKLNLLAVIAFSMWVATRMKTKDLVALTASTVLVASAVESVSPSAGLWVYLGGAKPPLFAVFGWVLVMISILGFSNFLSAWLKKLGLFMKMERGYWRYLPLLTALLLFIVFLNLEGYLAAVDTSVRFMYVGMALIGFFNVSTSKQSIQWNASVMVMSILLGGYMELIGSLSGLWIYLNKEILPIFIAIAWAINSWAVYGLPYLFGIDLAGSMVEVPARAQKSMAWRSKKGPIRAGH